MWECLASANEINRSLLDVLVGYFAVGDMEYVFVWINDVPWWEWCDVHFCIFMEFYMHGVDVWLPIWWCLFPGFSSDALTPGHDMGIISELPATLAAVKNPTLKITSDEYNHERYPPGDPTKRAFAYFVLTGGRFVYSSFVSGSSSWF